jgi:hypothetical protein
VSPLNISILLHYYTTPGDYRHHVDLCHGNSPAVHESLLWFVDKGLLSCRFGDVSWAASCDAADRGDSKTQVFQITEKGEAMVKHLCAVQVPVCKWVQPLSQQPSQE